MISDFGNILFLTRDTGAALFRRPSEFAATVDQMFRLGVRSLPLVALTTIFTGAVMVLQVSYSLAAYGAKPFVGSFIAVAMVKELGPVLTAVMLAARVGAGITAELGSMAVTEQVDAMRALGASPAKKLVAPRLLALLLIVPLLTIIANLLGILGGMAIAVYDIGQTADYFWSRVQEFLSLGDVLSGLGKTFFFAYFIGVIACYNGLRTRGGATGVGHATTNTVVWASISIFISNFFLSKLFLLMQVFGE
ncbi:MAG: ABC transporter permease [Acidobacteria bacterium]|nr:ABC transporter permease [Acidobacteriota bacterium]